MKLVKILFTFFVIVVLHYSCSDSVTNFQTDSISDLPPLEESEIYIPKKDSTPIIPAMRKCIYLTIDDGPLNGARYIDSIATDKKVKTNLFVVGNSVDGSGKFKKYFEIFEENPYIEMYNHSYSHANNKYISFYQNPKAVLSDFEKNETKLSISKKIARLPGRNLWKTSERSKNMKQTGATSAELLAENGYKIYGWDVEWKYNASDYSPEQTIDELITEINSAYESNKTFTPQHVVLLMHDQMFAKVNQKNDLGELINKLRDNDYTFEYMSSYPESIEERTIDLKIEQ